MGLHHSENKLYPEAGFRWSLYNSVYLYRKMEATLKLKKPTFLQFKKTRTRLTKVRGS